MLKREEDGKFPSYYSSCRFCEHATPSKSCEKEHEISLFMEVTREWHRRFWEMNNEEKLNAQGCPSFELSKWCVNNNKDHFGNPVVRKTPKSWG